MSNKETYEGYVSSLLTKSTLDGITFARQTPSTSIWLIAGLAELQKYLVITNSAHQIDLDFTYIVEEEIYINLAHRRYNEEYNKAVQTLHARDVQDRFNEDIAREMVDKPEVPIKPQTITPLLNIKQVEEVKPEPINPFDELNALMNEGQSTDLAADPFAVVNFDFRTNEEKALDEYDLTEDEEELEIPIELDEDESLEGYDLSEEEPDEEEHDLAEEEPDEEEYDLSEEEEEEYDLTEEEEYDLTEEDDEEEYDLTEEEPEEETPVVKQSKVQPIKVPQNNRVIPTQPVYNNTDTSYNNKEHSVQDNTIHQNTPRKLAVEQANDKLAEMLTSLKHRRKGKQKK